MANESNQDQDWAREISNMVQQAMDRAREAANEAIAEARNSAAGAKHDWGAKNDWDRLFKEQFNEQFTQFGETFRNFGDQFHDSRRDERQQERAQRARDQEQRVREQKQRARDQEQRMRDQEQRMRDQEQSMRNREQQSQDRGPQDTRTSLQTQLKKGCLELAVLSLLHQRDMYGYEIVSLISQNIEIAEGTIYPLLKRIKEVGYCQTYLKESQEGPPRKYYSITKAGEESYLRQKDEWLSFVGRMGKVIL